VDTKNIDEAEKLIQKYREIMEAKNKIKGVFADDDDGDEFGLIDMSSQVLICLPNMRADVLEAIDGVLNDRYDKVVKKLKEI